MKILINLTADDSKDRTILKIAEAQFATDIYSQYMYVTTIRKRLHTLYAFISIGGKQLMQTHNSKQVTAECAWVEDALYYVAEIPELETFQKWKYMLVMYIITSVFYRIECISVSI